MSVLTNQEKTQDWHRADIVAALHKKGWSLRKLAEAHNIHPSTLKSALDKSYPKSEKIIAAAIGVPAETIWAKRFSDRNFKPVLNVLV